MKYLLSIFIILSGCGLEDPEEKFPQEEAMIPPELELASVEDVECSNGMVGKIYAFEHGSSFQLKVCLPSGWQDLDIKGAVGEKGIQGDLGPMGMRGMTGPVGPVGPQGEIGPVGIQGPMGPQGEVGPQGIAGAVGSQGATGAQGERGPQGETGPQGERGPTGPQGPQGEVGVVGNVSSKGSIVVSSPTTIDFDGSETVIKSGTTATIVTGLFPIVFTQSGTIQSGATYKGKAFDKTESDDTEFPVVFDSAISGLAFSSEYSCDVQLIISKNQSQLYTITIGTVSTYVDPSIIDDELLYDSGDTIGVSFKDVGSNCKDVVLQVMMQRR